MKRFTLALALTSLLSCTALAGDIPCGGYAPPAPDEPTELTSSAPGDVPSGGYTLEGSTDIGLAILQAGLSLLSV